MFENHKKVSVNKSWKFEALQFTFQFDEFFGTELMF